jgi:hypothetical protein
MIRFIKPFKGDYFHILPCFAVCVSTEEMYDVLDCGHYNLATMKITKMEEEK